MGLAVPAQAIANPVGPAQVSQAQEEQAPEEPAPAGEEPSPEEEAPAGQDGEEEAPAELAPEGQDPAVVIDDEEGAPEDVAWTFRFLVPTLLVLTLLLVVGLLVAYQLRLKRRYKVVG